MDVETLNELQIGNPEITLQVIKNCAEGAYECIQAQQYEVKQQDRLFQDEEQKDYSINLEIQPKQKNLTKAIILLTLQSQNKTGRPLNPSQQESLMTKQTHLHLNGRKIQLIEKDSLASTPNIKVLYLFDNLINLIEPLSFSKLSHLIQLSLYNNQLKKIQGLEKLTSLRRLYLERNQISRLEGLTDCQQLEELYLSGQNLTNDQEFTFDDYSLAAISRSIKILDLSNSRVRFPQQLYYLEYLDSLNLSRNMIDDFDEQINPLLSTMNRLRNLNLNENPVQAVTQKYRDQVVLLSRSIEELDGKKITQQERQYLIQLVQRKQIKSQQHPQSKEGKKSEKFEVNGQNKVIHEHIELTKNQGNGSEDQENEIHNQQFEAAGTLDYYQHKALKGGKVLQNPQIKKKSANLNNNADFTNVGQSHMMTKHVPRLGKR
ncbi:leucine-rich repeat protein [Stylonychia lemnae]|uniref:Leucine-rich repeat protein n=1 Tax=Stylonychia lemnae TaxID=5949 RepID=A0A077ZM58_STYLE|nr:leucine-rich repeat protein [Stylonychia lemnae]|eukprot:CDW71068.1 leucine-rich repeat protein [Stylonychia lemnae]